MYNLNYTDKLETRSTRLSGGGGLLRRDLGECLVKFLLMDVEHSNKGSAPITMGTFWFPVCVEVYNIINFFMSTLAHQNL